MISNVFSENRAEKRISLVYDESISGFRALDFSKIDEIEGILRSGITVAVTGAETINVNVNGGNLTVSNEVEINNTQGNPIPVSGNINVTNFPSIQNISGTVTASNLPVIVESSTSQNAVVVAGVGTVDNQVPVQIQRIDVEGNPGTRLAGWLAEGGGNVPISGTVTANVGNSVTVANLPQAQDNGDVIIHGLQIGFTDTSSTVFRNVSDSFPLPISGTVTANVDDASLLTALNLYATDGQDFPVSIKGMSLESLPISGTVTANVFGYDSNYEVPMQIPVIGFSEPIQNANNDKTIPVQISNTNGVLNSDNPLPISGTVTANVNFAGTNGTTLPSNIAILGAEEDGGGNARTLQVDSNGLLKVSLQDAGTAIDGKIIAFDGTSNVDITATTDGSKNRLDVNASGTVTANMDSQFDYGGIKFLRTNLYFGDPGLPEEPTPINTSNPLPISGTVTAIQEKSSNISNFNSSGTNGTVLIANSNRKELYIQNLATGKLYVKYGEEASNNSFNFVLAANTSEEAGDGGSLSDQGYTGVVSVSGVNPKYISWQRS